MLKYFHPITRKKDTLEDKDPPEGKEWPNLFGSHLSKVIPSSLCSIASCNTDITRVLKQAKHSFTKIVIRSSLQHRNMKFTSSQPSRAYYNPYFYQCEQKPNSIRQSFAR